MGRPRNRPRRPNHTGRSDKTARFSMMPHRVQQSAAYASLDLVARSLLAELLMIFNGSNNGSLHLSARDATARLGLSDFRPVQRAFSDLQDRKFVELTKASHFSVKAAEGSRARCWRISWLAWPECPSRDCRAPCWGFEQYAPEAGRDAARADRRLRALAKHRKDIATGNLPVVESTTMEGEMPKNVAAPVVESTTLKSRKRGNQPFPRVVESPAHIDVTMPRGVSAWWQSNAEAQIWGNLLLLSRVAQNQPHQLAEAA